jgi:hypothetical protein
MPESGFVALLRLYVLEIQGSHDHYFLQEIFGGKMTFRNIF